MSFALTFNQVIVLTDSRETESFKIKLFISNYHQINIGISDTLHVTHITTEKIFIHHNYGERA